LLYLLLNRI